MNRRVLSIFVPILIVVVSTELNENGKEQVADSKKWEVADDPVRALVEAGRAANSLPPGVVLRVEADLSNHRIDSSKKFQEAWEFTSHHVHRVVYDLPKKTGDKGVYRRVESLPFNSKNLCKDMLERRIFAIEADEGAGEYLLFAGTGYGIGDRYIEILVNGKSWFLLGEACTGPVFAETDARAFAALYEQLATQARLAFQAKPVLAPH